MFSGVGQVTTTAVPNLLCINILYNEIILGIQKQAICFYKSVSLYRHNTLIEQYININTGMLCNKYMNMKKVKKEEKKIHEKNKIKIIINKRE